MNLQRMIALFMDYCMSKQLRPKTMKSYEQALQLFARWLREEMDIDDVEDVKEPHIRAYIVDLQKRGKYTFCVDDKSKASNHPQNRRDYRQKVSNITINNYLRNLRAFFRWLVEVEYIDRSPMQKIRLLPDERQAREYLEDNEVVRLLKSLDKSFFPEYRDYVLIMLMLDSGTRVGETLSIEMQQINLTERSIMIYGYARCSTDISKQDINRQIKELKVAGADEGIFEYEHGDSKTKKELTMLLELAQAGDTIITLEVSRLSRSTQQLCEIIEVIREKRLRLVIVGSITIDCRNGEMDAMSSAFLKMAGVFAELELQMIRARVKSGMQNAIAKGKKVGRRPTTKDDIPALFVKHYPAYAEKRMNVSELARVCGLSRPTVYKYLRLVE